MKDDSRQAERLFANGGGDVVGDRLSFAVFIGRKVDRPCLFRLSFDLLDDGGVVAADAVFWREVFAFDVDPKLAFGRSRMCPLLAITV